jgi:hypothetical protein
MVQRKIVVACAAVTGLILGIVLIAFSGERRVVRVDLVFSSRRSGAYPTGQPMKICDVRYFSATNVDYSYLQARNYRVPQLLRMIGSPRQAWQLLLSMMEPRHPLHLKGEGPAIVIRGQVGGMWSLDLVSGTGEVVAHPTQLSQWSEGDFNAMQMALFHCRCQLTPGAYYLRDLGYKINRDETNDLAVILIR